MALNFKNRGSSHVGKFSMKSAKQTMSNQFGGLKLSRDARKHFKQGLDKGGNISGNQFNKMVNDAHEKGLISSSKAEKMKDSVKLPDNYNKHW